MFKYKQANLLSFSSTIFMQKRFSSRSGKEWLMLIKISITPKNPPTRHYPIEVKMKHITANKGSKNPEDKIGRPAVVSEGGTENVVVSDGSIVNTTYPPDYYDLATSSHHIPNEPLPENFGSPNLTLQPKDQLLSKVIHGPNPNLTFITTNYPNQIQQKDIEKAGANNLETALAPYMKQKAEDSLKNR
jgi:hypothetical protein